MESIVRERIRLVLENNNSNPNKLSKKYSMNQKTLNNQINSDVQLSASTILLILSEFPNISSEWLLRGEGNMIKPQHEQTAEPQPALISAEGNTPEASVLYQIYNDAIKKMQELVEENTKLKAQVTELSEGSEELAKVLRSYHDSNQELADENQQLKVEIMIKESQLKEREKVILDYKELLKEAI